MKRLGVFDLHTIWVHSGFYKVLNPGLCAKRLSLLPRSVSRQVPIYDLPIWVHDHEEFPSQGIGGPGWKVGTWKVSCETCAEEDAHFLAMRERYPRYSLT